MKLKKSYASMGFLLLLVSLTLIGSINQTFTSQIILEIPKSSDGEITIITPENKTYTEPDSGIIPQHMGLKMI